MASDSDDNKPAEAGRPSTDDAIPSLSEEAKRRQRVRSMALAWALFALVVLFFLVTLVRLGANVANRPL